jgi:hypothetical protein
METILINTAKSETREGLKIALPKLRKNAKGIDVTNITLANDDRQPLLEPKKTVIDVVNDFSWYSGPKATSTALDKIPCAFLIEREQQLSSLISGALYYLRAGANINNIKDDNGEILSLLGDINKNSGGVVDKFSAGLKDLTDGVSEGDDELLKSHNLNALQGIYLTKPTGFQYRLPSYIPNQSTSSKWGDQSSSNLVGKFVQGAQDVASQAAEILNITQPGVYIENPQYFQNEGGGETKTIKFPLINTIQRKSAFSIQANYELLWLLMFQNKPYKTSFARTPPPKIYTVSVPGQFSFPYAYISKLEINFLGTIRRTDVAVPVISKSEPSKIKPTTIKAPIPDAYEVTIEFTSLIGDYGNTMISDGLNSRISTVGAMPQVTFGTS